LKRLVRSCSGRARSGIVHAHLGKMAEVALPTGKTGTCDPISTGLCLLL
jgi:hypothetical protein